MGLPDPRASEAAPPSPSNIFHRSLSKAYPTATKGAGVYLISADGRRILDGSSGAAVSCLGHGHEKVIEAIVDQARQLAFAHTSFFTNDPAEELASLLVESSHGAFSKVMFLSSGSEAVESAIKLARQYFVSKGEVQRVNFIARKYSYHGNTLGALSAGYNPPRRQAFSPLLSPAFHHVSPCFFSRDARPGQSEDEDVDTLIREFEDQFQLLGPSSVAAVIVEPVVGATLGSVPAAKGYLGRLKQLCEKHGALLIFDEVMCGMGRTGTLHAWQSLGSDDGGIVTSPDLQTIGKGLGAGYQPISAVLVAPKVHAAILASETTDPFISGHTYQAHAIGCAAALATQRTLVADGLLANVRRMGAVLRAYLETNNNIPLLREVRGLGLFLTVEFATDRTASTSAIAAHVAARCLQNGAAVYLCSSAVDAILFAPPFIITEAEVLELGAIFKRSVVEVLAEMGIRV